MPHKAYIRGSGRCGCSIKSGWLCSNWALFYATRHEPLTTIPCLQLGWVASPFAKMKINKDLLPIKLHYFLRYAGSAPQTLLLPMMVRQKGLSTQVVGLLWTVLPIVGLITNSVLGTMADYYKAHRTVFLGSIIFLTTGITAIYWTPKICFNEVVLNPNHNLTAFTSNQSFTFLNLTVDTTFTKHSNVLDDSMSRIDQQMVVEGQAPPLDLMVSSRGELAIQADTIAGFVKYPQFWLVSLCLMIEQMGIITCVTISDAVCFQILGSERQKYGQQRLWGTIGMGVMAVISGALVDVYSRGLPQQDYLPAIILCIVLMTIDLAVVARIKIPYTKGVKLNLGDVGHVLRRPQVLLFLVTVCVMGSSLGVLWVFKLMLVEDVALAWDPQFPDLKLLQGLVIGIEAFGGELLSLFIAGRLIQRLGHTLVMGLAFAAMSLQCCLVYTITNPWWFLPLQFLNGTSYVLFHTAMSSYASRIAPPGAQSTMQSVVKISFLLGQSTAGLIGGVLFHLLGGSLTFLALGLADLTYLIIFIVFQFLLRKYCRHKKTFCDSCCVEPGNSLTSGENSSDCEKIPEPAKEPLVDDAVNEKEKSLIEPV